MTRSESLLDAALQRLKIFLSEASIDDPEFKICLTVGISARVLEEAARQAASIEKSALAGALIERAIETTRTCEAYGLACAHDHSFH